MCHLSVGEGDSWAFSVASYAKCFALIPNTVSVWHQVRQTFTYLSPFSPSHRAGRSAGVSSVVLETESVYFTTTNSPATPTWICLLGSSSWKRVERSSPFQGTPNHALSLPLISHTKLCTSSQRKSKSPSNLVVCVKLRELDGCQLYVATYMFIFQNNNQIPTP